MQRKNQNFFLFSPKFEKSFLFTHVTVGKRLGKDSKQVFGDQKFLPQLGTEVLYPGGRIQHVPVVSHFAPEVADLGGNHLAAVRSRLETRDNAVTLEEALLCLLEALAEVEEQVHGARLARAFGRLPRDKDSVAGDLVYFSEVLFAAVGQELVVILHELAVGDMSQVFGDGRGTAHVDEHEYKVFLDGVLELPEHGIHENARAEFLVDTADERDEVRAEEQQEKLDVCMRVREGVDDVVHPFFCKESRVCAVSPEQDAEGEAGADERDVEGGTDQQGNPCRAQVQVVLKDDDVVDAVGQPDENPELQRKQQRTQVHAGTAAILYK